MKSVSITKIELIFLSLLMVVGSFLRLYRIEETAMFLGDQGRDAIIAKNILKEGDVALIGPVTSVGNMYLGPFYYYFMVPWLAITYPNPIGPAIGVALVGIATIPLLYFVTRKMFSKRAAYFTTLLFTVSSTAISQVRFSWNPNLTPIVGLLIFYALFQAIKYKKYKYLTYSMILYAIAIQLHYVAALLAGMIGIVSAYLFYKRPKNRKSITKHSILGILLLVFSTIPLIVFNYRHDGIIQEGFSGFFTSSEEHIRPASRISQMVRDISGNTYKLSTKMYGSKSDKQDQLGLILIFLGLLLAYKRYSKSKKMSLNLLLLWFVVSSGALSLYSSDIFTHYIGFSQAVSFILLGVVLAQYSLASKWKYSLSILVSLVIVISNLSSSPAFIYAPSQISVAEKTSDSIYSKISEGEKYNIVLISGTHDHYAQSYRYFLETTDRPPQKTDSTTDLDALYIIQEDYFDSDFFEADIYQIDVFPNKTPEEVYTLNDGPTITVLRKTHEE